MVFHNSYYPNTESKSVDLLDRYKKIILNCSNYIITPYMLTFEFIMESSPSIMSWITTKLLFIINLSIYIRNSCLIMRFNGKWNWLRFRASWRNAYFVFFLLLLLGFLVFYQENPFLPYHLVTVARYFVLSDKIMFLFM